MQKTWEIKNKQEIPKKILDAAGNKILAELLLQRGINTAAKIKDFLNPLDMKISSPSIFTDMEKSLKRIDKAIKNQEKIIIFGDFDCDGVTSTALLFKTLKFLGANVGYYVPTREFENHGLNTKAIVKLISKEKAKLFITVDCGISNLEEVKFINSFKADIIITDHHEAPDELPDAFAIINPKAPDSLDKNLSLDVIESMNCLAGVGVAFKLACALLDFYDKGKDGFANELLPLVAVGTIADVVPILGENRFLVAWGLKMLEDGQSPGLQKLLEVSGYKKENGINSETIAFGVAPRINAAGRLETVENALNLLLSENSAEITVCAETLNNYNKIRQELSDSIFAEAVAMYDAGGNSIILFKEDWHIGIIGIVASKLVEKFYKPVFLMTKDESTGFIRCSARSVKGLHLHDLLNLHKELFEGFGGHSLAAGLFFDPKKTGFEEVKSTLSQSIDEIFAENKPEPAIAVDMELDSSDLNIELLQNLEKLQPFGAGNLNPIFTVKNLIYKQSSVMGANKNHLKIFCEDDAKKPFECVYWNQNRLNIPEGSRFDLAFYPKINTFNGITTIQLDIQDIKSDAEIAMGAAGQESSQIKILDHRKKTGIFDQICDYLTTTKLKTTVFSENKEISKTISGYKLLGDRLCDRMNIKECTQIMFFDYPSSESVFKKLCEKSGAKVLHFMNFQNKKIDIEDLIKQISGMLKFASNNREGKIKISEIACFLSISEEITELCMEIFESLGMIEIIENATMASDFMKVKFINPVELSKIKELELYDILTDEAEKIYEFREILCKGDLESLLK